MSSGERECVCFEVWKFVVGFEIGNEVGLMFLGALLACWQVLRGSLMIVALEVVVVVMFCCCGCSGTWCAIVGSIFFLLGNVWEPVSGLCWILSCEG